MRIRTTALNRVGQFRVLVRLCTPPYTFFFFSTPNRASSGCFRMQICPETDPATRPGQVSNEQKQSAKRPPTESISTVVSHWLDLVQGGDQNTSRALNLHRPTCGLQCLDFFISSLIYSSVSARTDMYPYASQTHPILFDCSPQSAHLLNTALCIRTHLHDSD